MAHPVIERGLQRIVVTGKHGSSVAEGAITGKRPYGVHVHQFVGSTRRHRGLVEIDIADQMSPLRTHIADFKHCARHNFALHREVVVLVAGSFEGQRASCRWDSGHHWVDGSERWPWRRP